jgi:tetratricopeptide (TPR) repeat protein
LQSLEPNAILIPSGDHNTFPTIYLHYVEKIRPDITIADKYGYIEYALYQDMPHAPKRIRTRRQREEIEAYLIQQSGRPVYFTVKPYLELLPDYKAVSYGMLYRICGPKETFNSSQLPRYSYRNLADSARHRGHAAQVILSDYYFHLAANALRTGEIDTALSYIKQAENLSTGLKEEMNNLATLLAEFGQDLQAIYYYEQAAKLDPKYLTPRWNLAYLFKAQGDLVHAIQVFNDLAQIDPNDYRVFGELGFLLVQHGNLDLAIQNWGQSLALNPDQPQILQALAHIPNQKQPVPK